MIFTCHTYCMQVQVLRGHSQSASEPVPHAKFGDCFTAWLLAMPNGFFDLRIHIPCVTIAPDFVIFLEEA